MPAAILSDGSVCPLQFAIGFDLIGEKPTAGEQLDVGRSEFGHQGTTATISADKTMMATNAPNANPLQNSPQPDVGGMRLMGSGIIEGQNVDGFSEADDHALNDLMVTIAKVTHQAPQPTSAVTVPPTMGVVIRARKKRAVLDD